MYEYFISFSASIGENTVFGNIPYISNKKIKSIDEIREIENKIKKDNNLSSVIILNYMLLKKGV